MKDYKDKEEKDHGKKIIVFIIIVIVFLLLITSCSCTSKFFGKIGESLSDSINSLFKNEEDYNVDDDTNDEETISDAELKFDTSNLEVSLDDPDAKISFSYKSIYPNKFTCSTSDASIATCYVKDGYVVVKPKKEGRVTVLLQAVSNGKIYEAGSKVTVNGSTKKELTNQDNTTTNQQNTGNSTSNRPNTNPTNNNTPSKPSNNTTKPDNTSSKPSTKPSTDDHNYQLSTPKSKYNMSFFHNYGERNIILYTNLFTNQSINISSNDQKKIQLCSENNKFCVILTVSKNIDHANVELEYTGGKSNPSSLPFKIKANSIGKSVISVKGTVSGKEIANFDIEINAEEKYIVTIDANGGIFNELTKEYEFQLGPNEELDLSKYDEPKKINEEECEIYKFKGYSKTLNGPIEYDRDSKNIIRNLNHDLTLYAIYETTGDTLKQEDLTKTLWSKNAALFHNEEYYQKYKEDKVIYPGATGIYKMNFKNESSNKITITGMTLKEDTICIKNKGCLNMGYIIKYSSSESNDWTYYYGEKNNKYWILNSNNGTEQLSDHSFQTKIKFKEKERISLDPNEEAVISIFWRWEEKNDELDTLIGNHAAKKLTDQTINDLYSLSIGIDFSTELKYCKK